MSNFPFGFNPGSPDDDDKPAQGGGDQPVDPFSALMGGPALFPLVFTMAFGIVIGTYSSIYVALPVILLWGVKRDDEEAKPIKLQPARP